MVGYVAGASRRSQALAFRLKGRRVVGETHGGDSGGQKCCRRVPKLEMLRNLEVVALRGMGSERADALASSMAREVVAEKADDVLQRRGVEGSTGKLSSPSAWAEKYPGSWLASNQERRAGWPTFPQVGSRPCIQLANRGYHWGLALASKHPSSQGHASLFAPKQPRYRFPRSHQTCITAQPVVPAVRAAQ